MQTYVGRRRYQVPSDRANEADRYETRRIHRLADHLPAGGVRSPSGQTTNPLAGLDSTAAPQYGTACRTRQGMYVERDDFLEHEGEYQSFRRCIENLGLPLSGDSTVLDLGGGQGMHAGFLSCDVRRVYCCDRINYSALYGGEFIKLLAEKYERNGYPIDVARIACVEGDARDLLFRDGYFDWTLGFNLFEHVADPGVALREMIRVTRPGGHLYVTFDPIWSADTGSHFFHLVGAPWAHLLMNSEEFERRMRRAGASEEDVEAHRHGVNRLRLAEHRQIFHSAMAESGVRLIEEASWSGVTQPSHRWHPNFLRARMAGYSKEELLTRGLRYVLQKPAS